MIYLFETVKVIKENIFQSRKTPINFVGEVIGRRMDGSRTYYMVVSSNGDSCSLFEDNIEVISSRPDTPIIGFNIGDVLTLHANYHDIPADTDIIVHDIGVKYGGWVVRAKFRNKNVDIPLDYIDVF